MNLVRYFFPRRLWIPAICALVLSGCGRFGNHDPVTAMNGFFTLLTKHQYRAAYESAAIPFQMQLNPVAFEAMVKDFGLGDFASCTWTLESATEKEARLKGEFVSKNNQNLKFVATMIMDAGRWKLYMLETPSQDQSQMVDVFGRYKHTVGFNEVFSRRIPTDDETRKLVTETMLKFNEALHSKNFQEFYDYTSTLWQSQTTEEQVARAFKPYIDHEQTLDFIKDTKVIFDEPPRLNAQGYLTINGYYPTQPRLIFHLQYTFEMPKWKIIGISLTVEQ